MADRRAARGAGAISAGSRRPCAIPDTRRRTSAFVWGGMIRRACRAAFGWDAACMTWVAGAFPILRVVPGCSGGTGGTSCWHPEAPHEGAWSGESHWWSNRVLTASGETSSPDGIPSSPLSMRRGPPVSACGTWRSRRLPHVLRHRKLRRSPPTSRSGTITANGRITWDEADRHRIAPERSRYPACARDANGSRFSGWSYLLVVEPPGVGGRTKTVGELSGIREIGPRDDASDRRCA